MIATDKATYTDVLREYELPIFYQEWYLNVSCRGSHWRPYMLFDDDDNLLAVWISNTKKKAFIRTSINPQLTPYSGLLVIDPCATSSQLMLLFDAVVAEHQIVVQDFHPSSPVLPRCRQRITFVIPANTSVSEAYAAMKSDYRRKIRKAEKQSTLSEVSFAEFRTIIEASFAAKSQPNPFPMDLFSDLDEACLAAKQRTIIGIRDENGVLQGAAYFMQDALSWYYMAGASLGIKNGATYLIAQGIEQALSRSLAFDFEGSTIPSIAQYFKGFGGQQITYPTLTYTSGPVAKALLTLKQKLA